MSPIDPTSAATMVTAVLRNPLCMIRSPRHRAWTAADHRGTRPRTHPCAHGYRNRLGRVGRFGQRLALLGRLRGWLVLDADRLERGLRPARFVAVVAEEVLDGVGELWLELVEPFGRRLHRDHAGVDGHRAGPEVEEAAGEHVGRPLTLGVVDRLIPLDRHAGDRAVAVEGHHAGGRSPLRGDGDGLAHGARRLGAQALRPRSASSAVCRSAPSGTSWSSPNAPLDASSSFWGSTIAQHASTSSGASVVSWPVALATSQPWMSTSM